MKNNDFKENGYVLAKDVINEELRDLITQYALFEEIQNFSPDIKQAIGSHSKYSDSLMETMLLKLQDVVEEYTDIEVYPTYSFYRVYRNGAILHNHTDRPSCEISVTACFNYSYDDSEYTWPIIMDGKEINMKPGDIVIYRGIDLEHSRDTFDPPGADWHVQSFLHYVDINGPYKEWKYDKREFVGTTANKVRKPYIQYTGK